MLGAAWNPALTHRHEIAAVSNQPGRLVAFVRLGLLYPDARMIVAAGQMRESGYLNSDTVKMFLDEIGFSLARVEFEEKGRNTDETLKHVVERIKPRPGENWMLISSAFHMPRVIGIARQRDWTVMPYPTDFTATPTGTNLIDRFRVLNTGLREWSGLTAYALTERTSEFFPSPNASNSQ